MKKGVWVPSHLHFNLTWLAEADEEGEVVVNEAENSGVKWFTLEEALLVPREKWMVERIYTKLVEKCRKDVVPHEA